MDIGLPAPLDHLAVAFSESIGRPDKEMNKIWLLEVAEVIYEPLRLTERE